uniref:Fucosyltransferase n=1 Tax=Diabrotica virgifera virgifera TaxID=50390 RepID=A0A6P7GSY2_DIAVI
SLLLFQVRQKVQSKDYSVNKTKKVAWFVSNCGARNGRLAYARELGKYIPVDIYGTCGPLKCPRSDRKCFEILERDYKFYLAFENSNCRDYITEKFYVNGLGQNVLPIVMGARPEDYQRSAPEGSYIHVDEFAGPQELAAYLHRLDNDNNLYNSYFKWKGTGEFINTYFWCRLCAMMHAPQSTQRHYEDVNDWWRGPGVCTTKSWRNAEFV